MSDEKTSPGPWRWDDDQGHGQPAADSPEWHETWRLMDAAGVTVLCSSAETHGHDWVTVRQGDAALIASAPTLRDQRDRAVELLREMASAAYHIAELRQDEKDGATPRWPLAITELSDAQQQVRAFLAEVDKP